MLTGHASWVRAVAVTPDGGRAVSASNDRTLKVWDLESGRELQTLSGHAGWVRAVALAPDDPWRAVSASSDRTIKVWELQSGRELQILSGHAGWVHAVTVSRAVPDSRYSSVDSAAPRPAGFECSPRVNEASRLCPSMGTFGDFVRDVRRQIVNYKRFKVLTTQWIDLSIEQSRLKMKPGSES